jgi:exosortase/archaeosortase
MSRLTLAVVVGVSVVFVAAVFSYYVAYTTGYTVRVRCVVTEYYTRVIAMVSGNFSTLSTLNNSTVSTYTSTTNSSETVGLHHIHQRRIDGRGRGCEH